MKLADFISTRRGRIGTRVSDLKYNTFVNSLPVLVSRATVIEATSIFNLFRTDKIDSNGAFAQKVVSPWHISFVEMCIQESPQIQVGICFSRDKSEQTAALILRTPQIVDLIALASLYTDETGKVEGTPEIKIVNRALDRLPGLIEDCYATALMAFALSHCKNTKLEAVPSSEVLSRLFRQKYNRLPATYRVLSLAPTSRHTVTGYSSSNGITLDRALHICRGHFRTYSEQAKMFGRQSGTFWIDEHARGDVDRGVTIKDYRIPGTIS